MPRYDFRLPRLFVDTPLAEGAEIALERDQANYLVNVLRLKAGAQVLVFNGREGEWRASLEAAGKKAMRLAVQDRVREQTAACDLHYLFAPLKHARLDYMAQKAVEMGASRLHPILTQHTQVQRVNLERMRANAIEAAEQCGILTIPDVEDAMTLDAFVRGWVPERLLVFCDEDAEVKDPVTLLVGPEGGFAEAERAALMKLPNVLRLALGPRILRADTAAVAALALVQAVLGDWR
jgi:16S rRNA (uracil1498-N3)-methyltransferase